VEFDEFLRDTWQTALIFLTLLVLARLLGKTQVGQLTFYEYICGITIGSVSANVMASEPGQVWSHYYDLLLFCGLTFLAARVTLLGRPLRKLIEGSPTLVIDNGRILREKLREQRMDVDELMGQLREQGIFDVAEVQYAVLETTGGLSVLQKAAYKPVVRQDLNIAAAEARLPLELVVDGEVVADNLARAGVSQDWLLGELTARGIDGTDKVVYAVIDSRGTLQVRTA
jgi:uncharacterized membrane protein YcaP (DUF421 family)